jgi:2-polyprenyl-6-methoxyphenol hydroxylase-like FAD-dependent oxidoreductase
MAAASCDVLTVGGGLAGAALAKSLAERGLRVQVVEREREFKDRVRGDQMQPWGVAEARSLGLYELLKESCGHEQPWIDMFLGPMQFVHRNISETTPQAAPQFNFYHPRMQDTLLGAAAKAGADIRRGATVREVCPGPTPVAVVEQDGVVQEIAARLVVAADGRTSSARRWRNFEVHHDTPFLMYAGLLVDNMRIPEDTGRIYLNPGVSQGAYLFPQGGGRARMYSAYPVAAGFRLQGEKDMERMIEESVKTGVPAAVFEGIRPAGPLASFEAADTWVPHPYAAGLVLIGDAAASNDPTWGQGVSLTLRDVRVLRDLLVDTSDWESACHDYAREHDRYYGVMHEVTKAFEAMFLRAGPEADARRGRALPAAAQNPMRVPDQLFSGPDLPWNNDVLRVFFAEDVAAN